MGLSRLRRGEPALMSNADIPKDIKPTRRRTPFMIQQENDRILEYYKAGASHKQIRSFIGISERQYWKRIHQIQIQDIDALAKKQSEESKAFLHERMLEKLQAYEQGALSIATNKTYKATERIAAYQLARQLAIDQYSLEKYGVSSFIIPALNDKLYRGSRETARLLSEATTEERQEPIRIPPSVESDANRVF